MGSQGLDVPPWEGMDALAFPAWAGITACGLQLAWNRDFLQDSWW